MRSSKGFTIVELMVTVAVGSLLTVAVVGMFLTMLSQSPVMKARNTLSTNLQNALNKINDDVRRSSNVTTYNLVADPYAPTSKTGYENVPGPDPDTDDQYFWRMGESRLLLNQTPIDSSGNPIYDNAQYAVGKKNTIVYYVRDGKLFRRVVAAPYGNNSVSTTTCTRVAEGGCVGSDIEVISNLKTSLGAAAFKVTYFDRNGNAIPYTSKDSSGNDVPNYSGFPLARSIGVQIQLESGEVMGSQKVSISNTMRMQFRSELNVVPAPVVNPPYVPPTNGIGSPGLMIGPGGLNLYNSKVQGGDVYIRGKATVGFSSNIGGSSWAWWLGGSPANVNVANIGCGTGASYPQPCGSASPPINASAAFAQINGTVCAKDQVDATNIVASGSGQGLIAGCVPPDTDLPVFDKSAFVNSMSGTSSGSAASCYGGSATLGGNRTYTSDITMSFFCKVSITGSAYVTANFITNSSAQLKVAESVGKVRPIIVVNGKISMGTFTKIAPNSYGTMPYFISFYSADSTCSASPTCTSITPTKLKETLDNYTGSNSPVYLSNVDGPGASFYGYFGEAYLDFFTSVGAVAAQRVNMQTSTLLMNGNL